MRNGAGSEIGPAVDRRTEPRSVGNVHVATIAAVLVGLVVTSALAVAAWSSHEATEDRIMDRRTREAAAVFEAGISAIETSLSSVGDVVAATEGDPESFETLVTPIMEARGFTSASVWTTEGEASRSVAVVGDEPALGDSSEQEVRERLGAVPAGSMHVVDLTQADPPMLGYAYRSDAASDLLAYVESPLPKDRTAVPQADSAFADLHYAIFLADDEEENLLIADTPELPLEGRRSREALAFGDSQLILQMSATGVVGSNLSASLPWAILGLGVLLAGLFGVLYERVLRRRDEAAGLAQELARVAQDNARLYSEQRSVAQTLQQSLLLQELPGVAGVELAARFEAGADGVDIGGDWYDLVVRQEDCVLLVVGDVSGRGVRAATVMAALRHSIRALASQGDDPASILTKLSGLVSVTGDGHFATVMIAEIDPRRGSLAIASAGHPRPLVVTAGRASYIAVEAGLPVGVSPEPEYSTTEWQVQPGATLLGFTDGLFERRGETVDVGMERLRTAVEESAHEPLEALLDLLVTRFAGTPQDDAAILAVRWPDSMTPPRS